MNDYEKTLALMDGVFGTDSVYALATCSAGKPSVRIIDLIWIEGAFYGVTYLGSQKMNEIAANEAVAFVRDFMRFSGKASCIGHPLDEQNARLRDKLIIAFAPWYFAHNNEDDEAMCYLKIEPTSGFFHTSGVGYRINFEKKEAVSFPFHAEAIE